MKSLTSPSNRPLDLCDPPLLVTQVGGLATRYIFAQGLMKGRERTAPTGEKSSQMSTRACAACLVLCAHSPSRYWRGECPMKGSGRLETNA